MGIIGTAFMPPSPTRNLWRYYLFQGTWITPFFVPVIVLFWRENGLDPFDIYVLQGLFAVGVVVMEVPTGMVADRLGKRISLQAGVAALAVGFVIYALGHSFLVFFLAELATAIGVSLVSGADSALLYDTLAALDRKEEFRVVEGRARAIQMAMVAVATVIGGFVGQYSYRATLWMTAAGSAVSLLIALGFVETASTSAKDDRPTYGRLIGDALRFVRKHRLVRWYVLFAGVLGGSSTWLLWLYQPYMELVGLPVFSFGIAFALFNIVSALASSRAAWFDEGLGRGGALIGLGVLQVLPLPLMALLSSPFSVFFILGHQMVRGLRQVIITDRILKYTFADKRATVLSLSSMSTRLFFAATAPIIGWLSAQESMSDVLLLQGVALTVVLLSLGLVYVRIPAKYFRVKASVEART